LQENTSLFFAELLKLRSVLDELEKGKPCLVLLDEILRGTNSADKYHGAYEFIQKLIRHNALIIFATHDLKLCEMHNELPEITENYRFEGIIEGDKLHFPYKMEKGIVKNRTATFLMKQLKLIS
jgi:DNA mismatch repair ATPase MutS